MTEDCASVMDATVFLFPSTRGERTVQVVRQMDRGARTRRFVSRWAKVSRAMVIRSGALGSFADGAADGPPSASCMDRTGTFVAPQSRCRVPICSGGRVLVCSPPSTDQAYEYRTSSA